ncbi:MULTISPECIES: hypothetical protein [unclassified Gilliamella]|uniref:hypothetical protein n=1 Tax=unclassified Gilliamella TaxID=2685620 RepID=UPI00226A01D9|nr:MULTISPECIES: hypothetical protein [unclassified Gilliamella]MCX8597303.1 hypothetical protein [Gilliamella sp. B3493]MCX8598930.1 hypothetical protein [Gilliamella sp. B3486]MCX8689061.1 hypothetical protein [Gilliamella sp. B2973]MCX8704764.1 hypothetical protein [Gilliamella sp. B3127]
MENRTFEFRCLTRRSFIVLLISVISFALFVTGCLIFLFTSDAVMPLIPKQYFMVIFFGGIIVLSLLSGVLFAISIVSLFRKKMTFNANSYSINIDDHKKLNQMFQFSALQKVIMIKLEKPIWVNQTLILEFDNERIKMLTVKGIIPLLSKKDIGQFYEFIQYLHEQVLKPDFTLFSVDKTLSSKIDELIAPLVLHVEVVPEYRYLYIRK